MKKSALINSEISYVIAGMGHHDILVIGDCGLPVPKHVRKIDLALTAGVPGFMETLQTVLTELQVEEALVASELADGNQELCSQVKAALGGSAVRTVTHEQFKAMTAQAIAVIRTGECTPYANVILKSGVVF
jgi:D-ribose pyranase